jgi:hypothetical protein
LQPTSYPTQNHLTTPMAAEACIRDYVVPKCDCHQFLSRHGHGCWKKIATLWCGNAPLAPMTRGPFLTAVKDNFRQHCKGMVQAAPGD